MSKNGVMGKEKIMWDNSEFKVEFSKCDMKEFERVMLSSGQCSFFMPMGFMGSENGEAICYDCSGFSPLSMYRIERTEDALYLLEQVLLILGKAVEYLITPANITLTTDTVFYSKETGEVKIAYVPVEGEADLRKNIIRFLLQLKTELCDGKEEYLRKTAQYIYYHNYYIRDMVNKIGRFRRQLYREEHSVNQTLQGAV